MMFFLLILVVNLNGSTHAPDHILLPRSPVYGDSTGHAFAPAVQLYQKTLMQQQQRVIDAGLTFRGKEASEVRPVPNLEHRDGYSPADANRYRNLTPAIRKKNASTPIPAPQNL